MSGEDRIQTEIARLEQALRDARQLFGHDHPEVLTAMLNLAEALWAQGRLIAANVFQRGRHGARIGGRKTPGGIE